jgi:hypothetical protein
LPLRASPALETALRVADHHHDDRTALRQQGVAYVQFAIATPNLVRLMFGGVIHQVGIGQAAFAVLILDQRIKTNHPAALAAKVLALLELTPPSAG